MEKAGYIILGIITTLCTVAGFVLYKKRIWTITGAIVHTVYQIGNFSYWCWLISTIVIS